MAPLPNGEKPREQNTSSGGNISLNPYYGGGSIVIGLKQRGRNIAYPKILAKAGNGEGVAKAMIDPSEYKEMREERLSNRKPTTYNIK